MMNVIAYTEDSFELLKSFEDESVDIIYTDPPYSEHVQNNMCSGSLIGTKNVPKYESAFSPLKQFDWLNEALRVSRRWVLVYCAVEHFGKFEESVYKGDYVRSGIWYKSNSMGQLTKDRPAAAYEGLAILHHRDRKKLWNGKGSYGIWKCPSTRGYPNRHPNEKPVDLCMKHIALFSNRDDTILDLFSGSGAIGEACIRLGRKYIGYDQDREWVRKGSKRIQEVEEEYDMIKVSDKYALSLCNMR